MEECARIEKDPFPIFPDSTYMERGIIMDVLPDHGTQYEDNLASCQSWRNVQAQADGRTEGRIAGQTDGLDLFLYIL